MIIVDTNLVAYFVIPGTETPNAERVRARDRHWVSPGLVRHELLNVVAQQVRAGLLDRDTALKAYQRGLALLQVSLVFAEPLEILNLSQSSGCSPYDLEFVWLAMQLRVPLVTADNEVIKAFPGVAVAIAEFATSKR